MTIQEQLDAINNTQSLINAFQAMTLPVSGSVTFHSDVPGGFINTTNLYANGLFVKSFGVCCGRVPVMSAATQDTINNSAGFFIPERLEQLQILLNSQIASLPVMSVDFENTGQNKVNPPMEVIVKPQINNGIGPFTISFDFGDGTIKESFNFEEVRHTYTKEGTFDIIMTVQDQNKFKPLTKTKKITVQTKLPIPSEIHASASINQIVVEKENETLVNLEGQINIVNNSEDQIQIIDNFNNIQVINSGESSILNVISNSPISEYVLNLQFLLNGVWTNFGQKAFAVTEEIIDEKPKYSLDSFKSYVVSEEGGQALIILQALYTIDNSRNKQTVNTESRLFYLGETKKFQSVLPGVIKKSGINHIVLRPLSDIQGRGDFSIGDFHETIRPGEVLVNGDAPELPNNNTDGPKDPDNENQNLQLSTKEVAIIGGVAAAVLGLTVLALRKKK